MTKRALPGIRAEEEPRSTWFGDTIVVVLATIAAYLAAVLGCWLLTGISRMPKGPLWDNSFRGPYFFFLTAVTAGAFSLPFFQKEWGLGVRALALLSAIFLIVYTALESSAVVDPAIPFKLFVHAFITPQRHRFGF